MNVSMWFGKFHLEQGEDNPCEHEDELWLYNEQGEGCEIRSSDVEEALAEVWRKRF